MSTRLLPLAGVVVCLSLLLLLFPGALAVADNAPSKLMSVKQRTPIKNIKKVYPQKKKVYPRKRMARPRPPEAILLKDLATGRILFAQHADQPMPPASLTKIMSALVIIEEGRLEEPVRVSRRAAAARGARLRLRPGQIVPLQGLLEAMLIKSANDACLAAAEHVGGTVQAFVDKMNAKAAALNLTRTQFQNPCGFSGAGHQSTALELALLTEYAMANETFATIVKAPAAEIRTVDQSKVFVARTTNRLLGTVDGVIGVKTGYTRAAGRCLITVVRREHTEILLVLLNVRQRWSTAQAMIDYGLREAAIQEIPEIQEIQEEIQEIQEEIQEMEEPQAIENPA